MTTIFLNANHQIPLAQRMALWGKKILWIDEYRMIKNNPLMLKEYKPMEEYFVSDGWSGCNI